jgi:hypothetical protein
MPAELTLSGGDYGGIAGLLAVFLAIPVTLIVFNLRTLTRRVEVIESAITERVSHKDWVRVVISQQNRMQEMAQTLATLGGKLDATIGIAGGLKRIGDALEHQTEMRRDG